MVFRRRRAQSIIEYVMLFVLVAAAVSLTYKYLYRSMNARLENIRQELSPTRG